MTTPSLLGTAKIVAFVATTSPSRAKRFYRGILGLRLVSEDQFALAFDAGGTMLRVATVDTIVTAPYTVLGWRVSDIAATVKRLRRSRVKCQRYEGMDQDELGVWTSPSGARVAWFKDPDGNVLSVTQV